MKDMKEEGQRVFQKEMKVLEEVYPFSIPSDEQLSTLLQQLKVERKRAFIRECAFFIIIAFILFTLYALLALKLTVVFISIQGITFFIIPLILIVFQLRRQRPNGVSHNGDD